MISNLPEEGSLSHSLVLCHAIINCKDERLRGSGEMTYYKWKEREYAGRQGIFELRAQFGSDISRILYFFIVNGCAVLTHGFIKKTEKTPPEEIERAKRYRAEYLKRRGTK